MNNVIPNIEGLYIGKIHVQNKFKKTKISFYNGDI